MLSRSKCKLGLNPRHWAPSPGPLPGSAEPGSRGVFENGLSSSSVAPAPHIQWCSQGLCGETMGKRGPLLAHSLCRRLSHARPPGPAGLSFLGVLASQPPPAATAHSPALSFPGASGIWPWSQPKDGGEPWSPLPHPPAPRLLHAGTRVVGMLDSSWAPVPSSAHPHSGRPQRGERNRPLRKSPSRMGP